MLSKKGHVSLSGTQTKHLLTEQCLLQWYFSKHCSAKTFSIIFYCVHCINFTITNGFNSVQSLSHVWLFAIPWVAAHQASLSITNSQSLLRLMSIESVMPSNHLILCHPLFPALNLSQHQDLFKWVSSLYLVAKVLEFQLQHQSFQWVLKIDFL